MTQATNRPKTELSPERRALLFRKGQILYGKSCRTRGGTSCFESFALHQLRLGSRDVVHDLLQFLDGQLGLLKVHDPDHVMPITEALATRIRSHLKNET
jgi:hypothetical protein